VTTCHVNRPAISVKGDALQAAGIVELMTWLQGPVSPLMLTQPRRKLAVWPLLSLLNLISFGVRVQKATKRYSFGFVGGLSATATYTSQP
jgi:hypothetical protein